MKAFLMTAILLGLASGNTWGRMMTPIAPPAERAWMHVNEPSPGQGEARTDMNDNALVEDVYRQLWSQPNEPDLTHVKVEALGGRVRLQGQAVSIEEKRLIERVATEVAGTGNVTNQLEVPSR